MSKNSKYSKLDFKTKALLVIEQLCCDDIMNTDINKLKKEIFRIAHSATRQCNNKHREWVKHTIELYKEFKKNDML